MKLVLIIFFSYLGVANANCLIDLSRPIEICSNRGGSQRHHDHQLSIYNDLASALRFHGYTIASSGFETEIADYKIEISTEYDCSWFNRFDHVMGNLRFSKKDSEVLIEVSARANGFYSSTSIRRVHRKLGRKFVGKLEVCY